MTPAATLIVGPSWVGDMVMAQALFIFLKERNPDNVIDVLAPAWSLPIVARMPEIRRGIAAETGHGELGLGKRRRIGYRGAPAFAASHATGSSMTYGLSTGPSSTRR